MVSSVQQSSGPRVLVVSGSVGAGHDGVARELATRLAAAGSEVAVRDFLDAVPRPLARLLREAYTGTVMHVPLAFELLFQRLERHGLSWRVEQAVCRYAQRDVLGWAERFRADLVVSTYPLACQTVGALRAGGRLAARSVTYLTDPAVHASWVHHAVDRHLTATAATAAHGATEYGTPCEVAGPLVPERFSRPLAPGEAAELRRELSPEPDRPMALLATGSLGLGDVAAAVDDVTAAGFTAVVLCGRNAALRRRWSGRPGTVALGWRTDVDRLMQAADVLVHNAGGLSFSESLVAGLPAVTYRPIPGHGRANARVLDAAGLAPWARNRAELATRLWAQAVRGRAPQRFPDPVEAVLGVLGDAIPSARAAA